MKVEGLNLMLWLDICHVSPGTSGQMIRISQPLYRKEMGFWHLRCALSICASSSSDKDG